MGATTTRWALPYPAGTDVPDVPLWMQSLAVALDNVAMDDQGTLAARPVSTVGSPGKRGRYYLVTGDPTPANNGRLWRDNGAGWDEIVTNVPVVTALPGTPYDGQEIRFLADSTNGVVWHLKYRAGSASAYKWEFLGGGRLTDNIVTQQGTNSAAYVGLATAGPSVTVPLAGDFLVEIGAQVDVGNILGGVAAMSYDIGANAASDNDRIILGSVSSGTVQPGSLSRLKRQNGILAAAALVAKYKSTAGTSNFTNRWMAVTPIRVG